MWLIASAVTLVGSGPLTACPLYAAIKRGDLRMMKFGDKSLFLASDLAEFLSKLEPAA